MLALVIVIAALALTVLVAAPFVGRRIAEGNRTERAAAAFVKAVEEGREKWGK